MRRFAFIFVLLLVSCSPSVHSNSDKTPVPKTSTLTWPSGLPVFDHIVIVVEENKDYEEIIGNPDAPYINDVLKKEGANFTHIYGAEHFSQGNYYWMFSGGNQTIGFIDHVPSEANHPDYPFKTANLGEQLIHKGLSFKGYSESLPEIGFTGDKASAGLYARKHVPWISFANVPNGTTAPSPRAFRRATAGCGKTSTTTINGPRITTAF